MKIVGVAQRRQCSWCHAAKANRVVVELGSRGSGGAVLRHNSGGGVVRQWQCGGRLRGAGGVEADRVEADAAVVELLSRSTPVKGNESEGDTYKRKNE